MTVLGRPTDGRETDYELFCRMGPMVEALVKKLRKVKLGEPISIRNIHDQLPPFDLILRVDDTDKIEVDETTTPWTITISTTDKPDPKVMEKCGIFHEALTAILWNSYHLTERSRNFEAMRARRCSRYFNDPTIVDGGMMRIYAEVIATRTGVLTDRDRWVYYSNILIDHNQHWSEITKDKLRWRTRWFFDDVKAASN